MIFVSSDQITRFQSPKTQHLWARTNYKRALIFASDKSGIVFFSPEARPASFSARVTALTLVDIPKFSFNSFVTSVAVLAFAYVRAQTQKR